MTIITGGCIHSHSSGPVQVLFRSSPSGRYSGFSAFITCFRLESIGCYSYGVLSNGVSDNSLTSKKMDQISHPSFDTSVNPFLSPMAPLILSESLCLAQMGRGLPQLVK